MTPPTLSATLTAPLPPGGAAAPHHPPLRTRGLPAPARLALSLLERLQQGQLTLTLPDGQRARLGAGPGPQADLSVRDWRVFEAVLGSGDIGFAQGYIDGLWHSSDLATLLDLLVRNREALESMVYGRWWGRALYRLRHWLNRNSRAGSRRNIHAHYDLGNAFYRLWLDPTMSYSSALFDDAGPDAGRSDAERLAEAQQAKYQRMLETLRLAPGDTVLEIGCGWGGFAETALRAGLRVTGLTLSTEQLAWARQRCAALGTLGQEADLRLQDYRDSTGRYDGIASIEMFEAVGEAYWPGYFQALQRQLKPGARACIQTIVIDERLFERYRQGTDFIQQYIFPGGMLPSPSAFRAQAQAAGLVVVDALNFGQHYARTLAVWRERFLAALPAVRAQGFDPAFVRTWEFYLCYCEAAFRRGNTDVVQFTLEHAGGAR